MSSQPTSLHFTPEALEHRRSMFSCVDQTTEFAAASIATLGRSPHKESRRIKKDAFRKQGDVKAVVLSRLYSSVFADQSKDPSVQGQKPSEQELGSQAR